MSRLPRRVRFPNARRDQSRITSVIKSRKLLWAEYDACVLPTRIIWRILDNRPTSFKNFLGRPWLRWKDNVSMVLVVRGCQTETLKPRKGPSCSATTMPWPSFKSCNHG